MPVETFTRWLYRDGRPNSLARAINAVWARAFATGRGPASVATLEVVGRKSGKPVRLPVVIADLDGERYLVSMLGDNTNWVRNVRAAGHRAVLLRGAAQPFVWTRFLSSTARPSSSATAKSQRAAERTSPSTPMPRSQRSSR